MFDNISEINEHLKGQEITGIEIEESSMSNNFNDVIRIKTKDNHTVRIEISWDYDGTSIEAIIEGDKEETIKTEEKCPVK